MSTRYVTEGKLAKNEKEDAVAYLREYTDIHTDIVTKITNNLNHHNRSEVYSLVLITSSSESDIMHRKKGNNYHLTCVWNFGNCSEFHTNNLYCVRWPDKNFKFAIKIQFLLSWELATESLSHTAFLGDSTYLLCRHMLLLSRFVYRWVMSSVNPHTDL